MKLTDPRLTSTVALVAITVWIGGLLALGAIVAPIVFAAVPRELAADTMAVVFARFDKVAMIAAAIVLATEAVRTGTHGNVSPTRPHVARVGVSVVLVALAVIEGLWVTPTIARLHAEGAVRGVGEAGMALASAHSMAETLGKAEALLAIVLIALHVMTLAPNEPAPKRALERARA